ncbi:cytochrome P450 71A9-like [Salvia divinorum]|uniref:Cytochrome P450 71A9-like n=1 Tax=Salvia divinorum TaxID=28513 RepID=A0ABD1IIM3_SALDI
MISVVILILFLPPSILFLLHTRKTLRKSRSPPRPPVHRKPPLSRHLQAPHLSMATLPLPQVQSFRPAREEEVLRMTRSLGCGGVVDLSAVVLGEFFVSDYLPWLGWMDRVSGLIGRLDRIFKDMDGFFEELIHERVNQNRPKSMNSNILDILIKMKKENSSSVALTWDNVKAILMDIFVDGTDTSAATIIWAMSP